MKSLITAFLLLALPSAALAQRHYAILSLVGDDTDAPAESAPALLPASR